MKRRFGAGGSLLTLLVVLGVSYLILSRRDDPAFLQAFRAAFAKRPAEELYDLSRDPFQLTNVNDLKPYNAARADLRAQLDRWMAETADPLADPRDRDPSAREPFDDYPYVGPPATPERR